MLDAHAAVERVHQPLQLGVVAVHVGGKRLEEVGGQAGGRWQAVCDVGGGQVALPKRILNHLVRVPLRHQSDGAAPHHDVTRHQVLARHDVATGERPHTVKVLPEVPWLVRVDEDARVAAALVNAHLPALEVALTAPRNVRAHRRVLKHAQQVLRVVCRRDVGVARLLNLHANHAPALVTPDERRVQVDGKVLGAHLAPGVVVGGGENGEVTRRVLERLHVAVTPLELLHHHALAVDECGAQAGNTWQRDNRQPCLCWQAVNPPDDGPQVDGAGEVLLRLQVQVKRVDGGVLLVELAPCQLAQVEPLGSDDSAPLPLVGDRVEVAIVVDEHQRGPRLLLRHHVVVHVEGGAQHVGTDALQRANKLNYLFGCGLLAQALNQGRTCQQSGVLVAPSNANLVHEVVDGTRVGRGVLHHVGDAGVAPGQRCQRQVAQRSVMGPDGHAVKHGLQSRDITIALLEPPCKHRVAHLVLRHCRLRGVRLEDGLLL